MTSKDSKFVRTSVYLTPLQQKFIRNSEYSLSGLVRKTVQNLIERDESQ